MHRLREYTFIGAMMVLGVILGMVYVNAAGSQATLTVSEGEVTSVEERIALENEAIQIALVDPRVKPLVEGKEVKIFSTYYTQGRLVYTNETTEGPGWIKDFEFAWDGKYRALVTIRYPDDTGYSIHVDITGRMVEEPRKAYWKGGNFYVLTP